MTNLFRVSKIRSQINLLTSPLNALIRYRGLHWVLSSFLVCRTMNKPKIVIVGAGPSGIACATKLLDYGFENVMIVEAESRIGGRIHTIPFADNVIDLGAQWCHGEKDNIVYELAHKHNLLQSTGDVYESYQCIRSNREIVSESISQRLKDIVNDSLVTRQMELRNSNGSLGSYLTNKFYEALRRPENSDIDMAIAREFFDNYQKFESSVEASDTLDDVSGHGYLEYWECEGDILLNWKDKGYVEFLRLLMKAHEYNHEFGLLEERILLNHRVTHIDWNRYDSCVQLRCGNGENFLADHVIITVSLGVLKEQHLRTFEPKLPMDKQRAIDGLAFGTVNKIFIEFPEPFWPKKWTGFTMLWREEDIGEIRGTARAWLEDVFGFYCDRNQPRLLSGWIIGANGRHMEILPEDEILDGCMYLFRKFLPWDIPEPCNFKTSTWYTNENFRGSYSFRSMYTEEIGTSARELAQPLYVVTTKPLLNGQSSTEPLFSQSRCDKPVVQFAGEATSDHYFSTVHGAVEAGWREAKRLAELYNMINGARGKIAKSHLFPLLRKRKRKKSSAPLEGPSSVLYIQDGGPKIIIIGAGAAGLACAMKLLDNGFTHVRILEAENRIGGRILTIPFGNNVIDLGAQFCHGEEDNIVYEMLSNLDLLETSASVYNKYDCIRSNGEVLSQDVTEALKSAIASIFDDPIEAGPHESFSEYLRERFFQIIDGKENVSKRVAEEFFENFKRVESSETAFGIEEASAKGVIEYWICPGDYMLNFRNRGYISFLRVLIESSDDQFLGKMENRIKFNCTVEQIEWGQPNGKATVRCNNENITFEADHVIVTASLGVLKERADTLFVPALPLQKKRAIVALGYTGTCKIFLEFPQRFWPEDWTGFTTLWRKQDIDKLRRSKWAWLEEIFGFYCVNYQPRVLLGWIVGPYVLKIESLPRDVIQMGCMKLLRRFLHSWLIPEPIAICVTNWHSNPNFRGAYSFRSMLTEELGVSAEQLADPLVVVMDNQKCHDGSDSDSTSKKSETTFIKPVVQFAGEATSCHYYSTVHGAVESGFREADRILQYYSHE
ncbi:uncharacterized protein ACN427_002983 [Glossina fuscipes fuscipes]